jgi:MFS family permease
MALDVAVEAQAAEYVVNDDAGARPTVRLPLRQLFQLSVYWFGINAIMGGLGIVVQKQVPLFVPAPWDAVAIVVQSVLTMLMAAAIQPTIGTISDYTISRWGRRKPFIAIGATLDVLFLIGLATSQTYLSVVAFLALLQFSSNFAQGPFQGFVPDLVPARQVGLASALIGAMQTIGFVIGNGIIALAYTTGEYVLPLIFLGLVELATAIGTVVWVREGSSPKPRNGRSWLSIGRSAWGLDILRERSFVFLVLSRLAFIAGIQVLLGFYVVFLTRVFGFGDAEKAFWVPVIGVVVALLTAIATIPSGILSNRVGRKPLIYVAAAVGSIGLVVAGLAPGPEVLLAGATLVGIASGTFLAVDWALMTDIIPKASSGRFMGISNLAVGLAGPVAALAAGPIIDIVGGKAETGDGPRAAFVAGMAFFVAAAVLLRPVDPRPREARG